METLKYIARQLLAIVYALIALSLVMLLNAYYVYRLQPYGWLSVLMLALSLPSLLFVGYTLKEFVLARPLRRIIGKAPEDMSDSIASVLSISAFAVITILHFLCFIATIALLTSSQYGLCEVEDTKAPGGVVLVADCFAIICFLFKSWEGLLSKGESPDTSGWKDFNKMANRILKAMQDCTKGV